MDIGLLSGKRQKEAKAAAEKDNAEAMRDARIFAECFGVDGKTRTASQQFAYDRLRRLSGYDTPCFIFKNGQSDPYQAAYYDGCRFMFKYLMDFIKNNTTNNDEE